MAKVKIGAHELEMGSDNLIELRDSSDLVDDTIALKERLAGDGYLFIIPNEGYNVDFMYTIRSQHTVRSYKRTDVIPVRSTL